LDRLPINIRDYRITKSLSRGFYGAAYLAERGVLKKKVVLKISPVEFYSFFKKTPFEQETALHNELAGSALHVVGIEDAFQEDITFSDPEGTKIACYVTVLEHVDGRVLRDYFDDVQPLSTSSLCQIAIDLLRLRDEFESKRLNHNDLHAENLIVSILKPEVRRPDAIDPGIWLKAIDLGSISDGSKSGDTRPNDLLSIAQHIAKLLDKLLADPTKLEDRDYRVALSLQGIMNGLLSDAQNLRRPNSEDLIEQIRGAFRRASRSWRPWHTPFSMRAFADHYNAQTLESWNVPQLLVDPENRWLKEVAKPGPQIITGMRGCGKTMLLRSLDIHARAAKGEGESPDSVISRIQSDGFLGLFLSAQRLLDVQERSLEHRLTRLFVSYALQATRALLQIKDLKTDDIAPDAHAILANAIADCVDGASRLKEIVSLDELEHHIERIVVSTSRDEDKFRVSQDPAQVFPHLADKLRSCSEMLRGASVFYLLDDVSTRYLEIEKVANLLSKLLFQSPICAFKFTSEWQTIELGLQSPGQNHPIREGRDLAVFDLGADVFKTIHGTGKNQGTDFIAQVLWQRSRIAPSPGSLLDPRQVLGDVSLENVAREIAISGENSKQKKSIYRGISCLTSVCVGDIGDIIKLYDSILRRLSSSTATPVREDLQSDCFQELCSLRLYDLNRRSSKYKDHALAFGEAAHELLVRSAKNAVSNSQQRVRLRQYSSIYVRITAEDEQSQKQQIDALRDLIDAGVFVYTGGSPRTKTRDSNPTQQFKLTYRKVYGLAAHIGLSDRDRFELSGEALKTWLENPSRAKEILLRNQINDDFDEQGDADSIQSNTLDLIDLHASAAFESPESTERPQQTLLFGESLATEQIEPSEQSTPSRAKAIDVTVTNVTSAALSQYGVKAVFTGLGFEDRALASNEFLAKTITPESVYGLKYSVDGHANEIEKVWRDAGLHLREVQYQDGLANLPEFEGLVAVDISGLAKPFIFSSVRRELLTKGKVIICHGRAATHYPLQEDIEKVFDARDASDPVKFLEQFEEILKGETGPYEELRLLEEATDPCRSRALLAFASAKHERLFSLLERRDFDYVEVLAPMGDEPRARLARYAAEFVCKNHPHAHVNAIATDDLGGLLKYLDDQYLDVYGEAGATLELGLTGSKIQAVGAAILSARRKIGQAWYLRPSQFDAGRFSTGLRAIQLYYIEVVHR
jgi:hypothetical protein